MSTAILVDHAKRIADATVNDMLEVFANSEVTLGVTLGNLLHALLDHASRDTPPNNCSGLRYTAVVIYGAHNENRLTPVARVWPRGMLLPIKYARTTTTAYRTPPNLSEAALMVQSWLRHKLLVRQDYRCAVNRDKVDRLWASWSSFKESDDEHVNLRASHIIPQLFEANGKEPKKPSVTWTLLKHWTSNNIEQLLIDGIDNPSNAILVEPDLHDQPINRTLTLLTVNVESTRSYPLVTFHPGGSVAVPSPKLLAVYAALAGLFHASGFGVYFDAVWDERIAVIDGDGSTDIRALT